MLLGFVDKRHSLRSTQTSLPAASPHAISTVANQFSRRGPQDRIKKCHDDSTKDKIRAEMLAKRLEKYAKARGKQVDKHRMEPAQVQAAKVLIDRGKPVLQAVEQTILNPLEQMDDEQLREQVKALITANPWLLEEFKPALRPVDNTSSEPISADQTAPKAA